MQGDFRGRRRIKIKFKKKKKNLWWVGAVQASSQHHKPLSATSSFNFQPTAIIG